MTQSGRGARWRMQAMLPLPQRGDVGFCSVLATQPSAAEHAGATHTSRQQASCRGCCTAGAAAGPQTAHGCCGARGGKGVPRAGCSSVQLCQIADIISDDKVPMHFAGPYLRVEDGCMHGATCVQPGPYLDDPKPGVWPPVCAGQGLEQRWVQRPPLAFLDACMHGGRVPAVSAV